MIVTYRVFKEESGQYTFREVFYERDGRIITYGRAAITPKSGSLLELGQELILLNDALSMPVLTVTELEAQIAAQLAKPQQDHKTISHAELVKKLGLANKNQPVISKNNDRVAVR